MELTGTIHTIYKDKEGLVLMVKHPKTTILQKICINGKTKIKKLSTFVGATLIRIYSTDKRNAYHVETSAGTIKVLSELGGL